MVRAQRSVVIFDLGGVLLDWNPRNLYRKMFGGDDAAMEHFLTDICTPDWNLAQDAGRSRTDAIAVLMPQHQDKRHLIEAWFDRFDEMIPGSIAGTVDILEELHGRGTPLYALTNFGPETYPRTEKRFPFFRRFRGVTVSGRLKMIKPDPRIYQHLLDTHNIKGEDAVFIDDVPKNAMGGASAGIHGIHFTDPAALRRELVALGLL
ncbi:MAG: HAD family phosphatase [Alphaproteobacteria bacterium]|nr:HAD family phosphatase [Alphaproteobacteria bacterium]